MIRATAVGGIVLAGMAALAPPAPADAGGVHVAIIFGRPPVPVVVVPAPPVVVAPSPVVIVPRPVYVYAPPAPPVTPYYAGGPVVYHRVSHGHWKKGGPPTLAGRGYRKWKHHDDDD